MNRIQIMSYAGVLACMVLMCASFTCSIITSLTPSRFTFFFDPLISPAFHKQIMKSAHEFYHSQEKNRWSEILNQQFPFIKKITAKKTKPCTILISIEADRPWLLANENAVLTLSGVLVGRDAYASHYLDMPTIQINIASNRLEQFCIRWLEQIPKDFVNSHIISIENSGSIIIQDRLKQQIPIRMNAKQKIDQAMIEQCADAQQKLISYKKIKKIIPTAWVADFRFCKQIVLYQAKGREDKA